MAYRVELTVRAARDLEQLFADINASRSLPALKWFSGLERAILSLERSPQRCSLAPESRSSGRRLRHLLYGRRGRCYRAIFAVAESRKVVHVLTVRYWARAEAEPEELD